MPHTSSTETYIPLKKILFYFICLALCLILIVGHAIYTYFYKPIPKILISTPVDSGEAFDVYLIKDRNAYVLEESKLNWYPDWMKDNKVYGRVFETNTATKEAHLDIHVYTPCPIDLIFLSNDATSPSGKRLNPKITFSSIKLNGQEILSAPKTVYYDNIFVHNFHAQPGKIKLDIIWQNRTNQE